MALRETVRATCDHLGSGVARRTASRAEPSRIPGLQSKPARSLILQSSTGMHAKADARQKLKTRTTYVHTNLPAQEDTHDGPFPRISTLLSKTCGPEKCGRVHVLNVPHVYRNAADVLLRPKSTILMFWLSSRRRFSGLRNQLA